MAHLDCFSTVGLDARRKIALWNDRACETISPLVSDPMDLRTFNGSMNRLVLGDLSLTEVYSEAQIVRHSRNHVARTRSAMFFLNLMLEGQSSNRQDGREARLEPGDFTLFDSTRQYEVTFPASNRMLVLAIPDAKLRRHVACPESLVAVPMRATTGVASLLSRFLRNFWAECSADLESGPASRVALPLLDLVGAAYATVARPETNRSSLATVHRVRILDYIETHLHDPDLTPTRIAEECRMTPRYLHHLFSEDEETVSRYILRRRLEACAQALESPAQRTRTVTSIAFDYGFNSPTHFGRVFRSRFDMTPREYRRRNLAARA